MPLMIQGCKKERSVYKTIYLPERLADAVDRIALREKMCIRDRKKGAQGDFRQSP